MAKKYDCAFVDNEMPYGRVPQGCFPMAESSYLVYYVYQKIPRPCFKFHKNLKNLTFVNFSSFLSEKAKKVLDISFAWWYN